MTTIDALGPVVVVPAPDPAPGGDSPPAHTRVRARVPGSAAGGNPLSASLRAALAGWWAWTEQPASLRDTWKASALDAARIPGKRGWLRVVWLISNCTDRLAWFALLTVVPPALQGPARWIAARPTRRWALYLIAAGLAVAVLV
jgi:hypothetical protein